MCTTNKKGGKYIALQFKTNEGSTRIGKQGKPRTEQPNKKGNTKQDGKYQRPTFNAVYIQAELKIRDSKEAYDFQNKN